MEFEKRYKNLNAAQKKAVDTIDGPVMVIAGPGTGKTELLSMRVANILRKTDTLPENILCLTYTDNGADAMRRRLISIIGKDAYKVAIHTFHSFGSEIISQNRDYFHSGATFQPADNVSTYEILRRLLQELPLSDPLSVTLNDEYTHQSDVKTVISELKKAGLTSAELLATLEDNDRTLDQVEKLLMPILNQTVSKKMAEPLTKVLHTIEKFPISESKYEVPALLTLIVESLRTTLDTYESSSSTTHITAWKNRFFERNDKKELIFKARAQQRKLRTVAFLYDRYLSEMEKAGLYDYDDMILQVVHAVEVHDDLRFNLQEKYQYLLVDEFQDTNLAQMRILHNLTDNPVNEDKPNIFVVGDDDQAIYSFQGADISNILNFKTTYTKTERIVLTENYRSTQTVLDSARSVIIQGAERLENTDGDLSKQLTAHTTAKTSVGIFELESAANERQWIANEIKNLIASGVKANTIAVLIHRHNSIQELLPYFAANEIDVSYERRDNVLDLEPIQILEQISRIITALSQSHHDISNGLLPQLLAHPMWGFSSEDIWKLSTSAYDKRQRWLDVMETIPAFVDIRSWIINLTADASFTSLETMLDRFIGVPDNIIDQTEFVSPFYNYFFSSEKLQKDPNTYLTFLEALRVLRSRLIEYHPNESVTLSSFISFIELHRRIGDRIQMKQMVGASEGAINVMTAHSAKGLEFEHVYVADVTDRQWGQKARSRSRSINYPANLILAPNDESYDERLRLFYVALTRAKSHLTVSYSLIDDKDKPSLAASFLATEEWRPVHIQAADSVQENITLAQTAWYQPLLTPSNNLKKLLQPRLEQYRLSATHLNSFIDVSRGGPQYFLVQRLLHFPSSSNPHTCYGLAIHRTLQQVHTHFTTTHKLKPIEDILIDFEMNLRPFRMEQIDFDAYLLKGSDELSAYLTARQQTFTTNQKAELDFSHQQSMLEDVRLNGSLDLVDINDQERTITVLDYKTGKPSKTWQGTSESEKIKLYKYRQQLLFYKLLVEGSRDYGKYQVDGGVLEFIEPTLSGDILSLELNFTSEEVERFKKLATKVWEHIIDLNLPDTSHYDPTLKGLISFEQDLIDGAL
jgi:DNA helicase-2/ATP-dependent DNA helicase PcrA